MRFNFLQRISVFFVLSIVFSLALSSITFAQSRPQRPAKGNNKKNQRPTPKTPEELKKEAEERKLQEELRNAETDDEVLDIKTNIVSVDTVVYNKKSGQIITGLKQENFAIFENGKKQTITNFSMPESPITVSLIVEYSRWSELFGRAGSGGRFDDGHLEVIRPVAYFLSRFIKAPDDYASVVAFDMRPTPITDFTNDPGRLRQTVDLLLRNRPAFRENNLFDAITFGLIGGKTDAVVLEDSKERKVEYGGMVDVDARRRAIILVASGIDTFSRVNYDEVRRTIRKSGIPIYIISTGNLFFKKYEHRMDARDTISGVPGRLTFLQARNAMNTFAKESGGRHFEMTFPGEIPGILQNINALLRNQYSLAYDAGEGRPKDKKYKLDVKVDVNGDGVYDDDKFVIQHRPYYSTELSKEEKKALREKND
jgi:VWFA-related protein